MTRCDTQSLWNFSAFVSESHKSQHGFIALNSFNLALALLLRIVELSESILSFGENKMLNESEESVGWD
jgi:hypothetical protein